MKICLMKFITIFTFVLFLKFKFTQANKISPIRVIKENKKTITDKEFLKNLEELKNKIKTQSKSILKKLIPKFISKQNRYLIAGENIPKLQNIISLPFNELISINHPVVKDFCQSLNLEEFSDSNIYENQFTCLTMFIMVQIKKPNSEFKNYVKTLPNSFKEFFLFWPDHDVEKINNSFFYNLIEYRKKEINEYMEMIKKSDLKETYSIEDLKSAYIIVSSRNFGCEIAKIKYNILAPYMDMFNTNENPNTRWIGELKNFEDSLKLFSIKTIRKGEEVSIFYGKDDNSKYLSAYGFTLKDNPFTKKSKYFVIKYKHDFHYSEIDDNDSSKLVNILNNLKDFKSLKEIEKEKKEKIKEEEFNKENDKDILIKEDLDLFKVILKALKSYENDEMISWLKENLNESSNNENILRILEDENRLIQINSDFLKEFIEILEGGIKELEEKKSFKVVMQNKKYFESLIDD